MPSIDGTSTVASQSSAREAKSTGRRELPANIFCNELFLFSCIGSWRDLCPPLLKLRCSRTYSSPSTAPPLQLQRVLSRSINHLLFSSSIGYFRPRGHGFEDARRSSKAAKVVNG
ncbi:hypothetical protein ACFX2H_037616 [Malus domestica]